MDLVSGFDADGVCGFEDADDGAVLDEECGVVLRLVGLSGREMDCCADEDVVGGTINRHAVGARRERVGGAGRERGCECESGESDGDGN